jgi:hypothetical protein
VTIAANPAAVEVEIDGSVIPFKRVPQCRTCRSDRRVEIDLALAEGVGYAEVAALFPRAGLSARNVSVHHKREHSPTESPQIRAIAAKRTAEAKHVADTAIGRQVSARLLAESVLRRVWERLVDGEIEPTVRDALAASKLLFAYDPVLIERDLLRQRVDESHARLMRLFEVVDRTLDEENWDRLSLALRDDLDLKLHQVLYVREQEQRPRRRRARAS